MLELYHQGSSVCAAKVRLYLGEKGLDWTGHYIDILRGDQFTPEYMKLNPKAVVPTLVHDGKVICDSSNICEYLDDAFPDQQVRPDNPVIRAEVRYRTKAVDEDLHPACGAMTFMTSHRHTIRALGEEGLKKFLNSTPPFSVTADWHEQKKIFVRDGYDAPDAHKKVKLYDRYLQKMETALQDRDWLASEDYTFADIAMTPYVMRLDMMSMQGMWEGGRLPKVKSWLERIKSRKNFQGAIWDWMPDELTSQLAKNGAKSWPEVAEILEIKQ